MQEKGRCQWFSCKKARNHRVEVSPGILISVCPGHNRVIKRMNEEENIMLNKNISLRMKELHEEEDQKVVPITNKAVTGGFRRDNWLIDLPVGSHFLTYEGGMYLTEWTIMGRRGTPLGTYTLIREDKYLKGKNKSSCKWVNSYLFTLDKELKEILNEV
jgi:hypothetical protein